MRFLVPSGKVALLVHLEARDDGVPIDHCALPDGTADVFAVHDDLSQHRDDGAGDVLVVVRARKREMISAGGSGTHAVGFAIHQVVEAKARW